MHGRVRLEEAEDAPALREHDVAGHHLCHQHSRIIEATANQSTVAPIAMAAIAVIRLDVRQTLRRDGLGSSIPCPENQGCTKVKIPIPSGRAPINAQTRLPPQVTNPSIREVGRAAYLSETPPLKPPVGVPTPTSSACLASGALRLWAA
jgi:hypothetical protein